MARIKIKTNIGIKEISKLEVKSTQNEQTNSFKTADSITHHNCNG